MLSICIPHYNFINPNLFRTLFLQCEANAIVFEILIADDASQTQNIDYLKEFTAPEFKIFFLKENLGRATIRNFLAQKAQFHHLLFLDGDAEVTDRKYIYNYLQQFNDAIVSGGRVYSKKLKVPKRFLHWKYGSQVEQHSKNAFQSNNFLIPKAVFSTVKFDEDLKGYGYEDVLFGLQAKQLGFQLRRIDNPLLHLQLKTNDEFMADLEQALRNLNAIIATQKNPKIIQEVSVATFYQKLKKLKLTFLLSIKTGTVLRKTKELLFLNIPIGTNLLIAVYKLYFFHALQNLNLKDNTPDRPF